MRWLVTGAGGMLGRDLVEELRTRDEQVTGLGHLALDITAPDAVDRAFAAHHPDVVVNCAAYTAVDDAEQDEEGALRVNGDGPGILARACVAYEARLIQVSTDYVFAGDARTPMPRTPRPTPAPPTVAPNWQVSGPCWTNSRTRAQSCASRGSTASTAATSCGR